MLSTDPDRPVYDPGPPCFRIFCLTDDVGHYPFFVRFEVQKSFLILPLTENSRMVFSEKGQCYMII